MPGNLYRVDVVSLLDADASAVLEQWGMDIALNSVPTVTHEALVEAFRERKSLSWMLKITREELNNIDPVMFPYLLSHQKEALRQQLIRAHYLHAVQTRIDEIELRWDGLKSGREQCALYAKLLTQLRDLPVDKTQDEALQLEQVSEDYVKPFSWFGMTVLAPWLASTMFNVCAGKTNAIKSALIDADKKNTYLGWSRALILSTMSLIPKAFVYHNNEAHIRDVAPTMSFLNIFVVSTCLGIEFYLLMKNSFAGAWATRNQQIKVNPWEQFTTQCQQRIFVLLNWFFLFSVYFSAFLCAMIPVLNIWPWSLTFALGCRIIQLIIICARYDQDLTNHTLKLKRIRDQIKELNGQDQKIKNRMEKRSLELTLKKMEKDWELNDVEFKWKMVFTSCFFVGVMMFSCLIFPPALMVPSIELAMGFAGAAICFISILILSNVRADIAMERTRAHMLSVHVDKGENQTLMDAQFEQYLSQYIQLKSEPETLERDKEMKQLYLKMRQLVNRSQTQTYLLERQKTERLLTLARDILIPLAGLALFLFLPTGIGFGVVASLILMHMLIKKMIDVYDPIQEKILKFDEDQYQNFLNNSTKECLFLEGGAAVNRNRFYQPVAIEFAIDESNKPEPNDNL